MEEETRAQLDELMANYEQRLIEIEKSQEQKKIEEKHFLHRFKDIKKTVIKQVMKDIGDYLTSCNHDYHIHEQEEKITMEIFQAGIDRSRYTAYDTPSISFDVDKDTMKICIHTCTYIPGKSGLSGLQGEGYAIEHITSALVEQAILDVLKEILD
jgi:hypothetical protein